MKLYCSFFIPTREKKSTWNSCMGWKKCGKKLVLFNLFKMTKITLPKKKKKVGSRVKNELEPFSSSYQTIQENHPSITSTSLDLSHANTKTTSFSKMIPGH